MNTNVLLDTKSVACVSDIYNGISRKKLNVYTMQMWIHHYRLLNVTNIL